MRHNGKKARAMLNDDAVAPPVRDIHFANGIVRYVADDAHDEALRCRQHRKAKAMEAARGGAVVIVESPVVAEHLEVESVFPQSLVREVAVISLCAYPRSSEGQPKHDRMGQPKAGAPRKVVCQVLLRRTRNKIDRSRAPIERSLASCKQNQPDARLKGKYQRGKSQPRQGSPHPESQSNGHQSAGETDRQRGSRGNEPNSAQRNRSESRIERDRIRQFRHRKGRASRNKKRNG